jgi:hypothetical protein
LFWSFTSQRRIFLLVLSQVNAFDINSAAPKKGINIHPAFASGTTGTGRTETGGGLAVAVLCAYA